MCSREKLVWKNSKSSQLQLLACNFIKKPLWFCKIFQNAYFTYSLYIFLQVTTSGRAVIGIHNILLRHYKVVVRIFLLTLKNFNIILSANIPEIEYYICLSCVTFLLPPGIKGLNTDYFSYHYQGCIILQQPNKYRSCKEVFSVGICSILDPAENAVHSRKQYKSFTDNCGRPRDRLLWYYHS